ncbi:hypothetical protein BJY52DRAFT_941951 [Lactarius psammicola]|nr:hypothetical protein BJY52DRAFT_941951 [Lactarius psammicola]
MIPYYPSPSRTRMPDACDALTNNVRYLRPPFRHVFSLAPTHAPHALSFISFPVSVASGISEFALLVVLALVGFRAQEAALNNPARTGHRILQSGGLPTWWRSILITIDTDSNPS